MKLLLALDGSPPSLVARDLVAGLRWPAGTCVHVVGAYEVPVDWTGGVGSTMDWVGEIEDAARDQLVEELRALRSPLDAAGLAVTSEAVQGRPADAIVATAERIGADLIVTGSRGRGRLRSMLLGSVANEVASHATCPVLVARAPGVGRLVVATDGSSASAEIVERLEAWGVFRGHDADVVAVAVPEGPTYDLLVSLYTLGDERLEAQRREIRSQADAAANEMAGRLTEIGIPATPHVRVGDASAEILGAVDDANANLVITGSRGLGGIDRLLLGSVARNVIVHARCSVLIVRGRNPDPAPKEA